VDVSVVERGYDAAPLRVDDPRAPIALRADVAVRAGGEDAIANRRNPSGAVSPRPNPAVDNSK
jgi:hypothetical protein